MKIKVSGWIGGILALIMFLVWFTAYLVIPVGIVWAILKYCLS